MAKLTLIKFFRMALLFIPTVPIVGVSHGAEFTSKPICNENTYFNEGHIRKLESIDAKSLIKLEEQSKSGDLEATKILFASAVNEKKESSKAAFIKYGNRLVDSADLSGAKLFVCLQFKEESFFFDIKNNVESHLRIARKFPELLPIILLGYQYYDSSAMNYVRMSELSHPYLAEIEKFLQAIYKDKSLLPKDEIWMDAIWSVRDLPIHIEIEANVNNQLLLHYYDPSSRKNLSDEYRLFSSFLATYKLSIGNKRVENSDPLFIQLMDIYSRVKDNYFWANENMAQFLWRTKVQDSNEKMLKSFKMALHLYITRKAVDLQNVRPNEIARLCAQGFETATQEGDFESALYFQEIYKTEVIETELFKEAEKFDASYERMGRTVRLLSAYRDAILKAESGDYDALESLSLKMRESIWSDRYNSRGRIQSQLGMLDKLIRIQMTSPKDIQLGDEIKKFINFYEASGNYKNNVEYAAALGEAYAFYTENHDLANYFRLKRKFNDADLVAKHPSLSRTIFITDLYRKVYVDKDFAAADSALKQGLSGDTFLKLRHWEVQHFQKLIDGFTAIAGKEKAAKWSELIASTYVIGAKRKIRHKRLITPREKTIVSDFLYQVVDNEYIDKAKKFELFSIVQSLAVTRALDGSGLSTQEKKELLSHQLDGNAGEYLFSDSVVNAQFSDESALMSRVGENQALISFIPSSQGVITWTITNQSSEYSVSYVARKDILDAVTAVMQSVSSGGFGYKESFFLYRSMLQTAISKLDSKVDHIIYSPSYELSSLPLAILVTSERFLNSQELALNDVDMKLKRGFTVRQIKPIVKEADWLISKYAISVTPSLRTFTAADIDVENFSDMSFLGVGDPLLAGNVASNTKLLRGGELLTSSELHSSLINLPDASDELVAISKEFNESVLLLGSNATETLFTDSNPGKFSVISFATHALKFDELKESQEPLLVLTKDPLNDGLLTQNEILSLNLSKTNLVVLSACNTASSTKYLASEGFSGLATAFLSVGAKNVMVSHWSIYSEAATEVTKGFFKSKKKGFAKKMQESIKSLINSPDFYKRSPGYWGAFELIGS